MVFQIHGPQVNQTGLGVQSTCFPVFASFGRFANVACMNDFLIGLLSALIATNQPVAVSNFVARTTGVSVQLPDPNDPIEKEYRKILELDDAAQEEVDKWIRQDTAFREQGAGLTGATLRGRVEQRLKPVR